MAALFQKPRVAPKLSTLLSPVGGSAAACKCLEPGLCIASAFVVYILNLYYAGYSEP